MPANSQNVNVALIGTKFMGRTHSNAYLNVDKFFDLPARPVMHTLSARDERELAQFAKRWGWANHTTNWRDVCDNDEIHLVDIGTPNNVHAEMAVASLESGKHVACEKPLADTLDNARAMRDAAAKAPDQKTFVWFNYRRVPALALAHQLVREGKLGRIYHVRCRYMQDFGGPDTPLVWRFQGEVAGSGALGDLCAHSVDAARFVTGDEIDQVNGAILKTFIEQRPLPGGQTGSDASGRSGPTKPGMGKSTVDDAVVFTAQFAGGAIATFEATRLSTGDKNANCVEVHGEHGAIRFNLERLTELQWYDNTLGQREQGWNTINVSNGGAGHPYCDAWWPPAHAIGYEHTFIHQAADMIHTLGGQSPVVPLADFADAYQTQRVLAAVTESAHHQRPVGLSEIG